MTCFGVMDGHGLKGHLVTQFLAKQLPQRIAEQLANPTPLTEWEEKMKQLANFDLQADVAARKMAESQKDTQQQQQQQQQQHQTNHNALRHAFHQAHIDAMEAADVPAGRSGTTCIVCLLDDTHIHVAHVGDSRAVLYGASSWQALTTETTVANFASTEGQRIADGKGRVDGQGNVWYGPVGISMTRALGDAVMLQAGVVPTPIVQSFPRDDDDKNRILVLATDGIWDVLDNDCVGEIVRQYQDSSSSSSSSMEDLLDELIDQARKKWVGDLPIMDEEKVDDITCIVAKV